MPKSYFSQNRREVEHPQCSRATPRCLYLPAFEHARFARGADEGVRPLHELAAVFFGVDDIFGFLLRDDVQAHEIRGAGGLAGAGNHS